MKRLFNTLVMLLAINFLVLGGFVAWLYQSGHLDRARVTAIKETLFPPPASDTKPPDAPSDAPPPASKRIADLLAKHTGHSAADQVEFTRQTLDTTVVQLDRREREVADRERQVSAAIAKLAEDRKVLESERQQLTDKEQQADRLAGDKGFQDTLQLYNTMPARQVKAVFMSMDETSAAQYLDAMQPRTAAKILKEFKLTEESDRMKRILEKMRHPPGVAGPATQEASR